MRQFICTIMLCLLIVIPAHAADIDIDADSNDAVDVGYGGTNATTAAGARSNLGAASAEDLDNHEADLTNPHSVTATQAGAIPSSGAADVTTELDLTDGKLEPPSGSTLPASCNPYQAFVLTSGTSGQLWYVCESTDTWVKQGDGGEGGGGESITDLDDLPLDDTNNDMVDHDIVQQAAEDCLSSAPASPVNKRVYCADGDNWQPGSTAQGTDDWLVMYRSSDTTYVPIYNLTDDVTLLRGIKTDVVIADETDTTKTVKPDASAITTGTERGLEYGDYDMQLPAASDVDSSGHVTEPGYLDSVPCVFCVALSDESTDLTTGTAKRTWRMPYAMTLTAVRASVSTAPVGSTITVDLNESGATVLSTKVTIDASEETSETAATAEVISDSAIADDAEMTADVDQIGSTTAGKGLKICLIGTRDY